MRKQYLEERLQFFKTLEEQSFKETKFEDECDADALRRAIQSTDPDLTAAQVERLVSTGMGGRRKVEVEEAIKNMKKGIVRKAGSSAHAEFAVAQVQTI